VAKYIGRRYIISLHPVRSTMSEGLWIALDNFGETWIARFLDGGFAGYHWTKWEKVPRSELPQPEDEEDGKASSQVKNSGSAS